MKIGVSSRAEAGSYTDKNGNKVHYTEFICENFTFCDSKQSGQAAAGDGFMDIPEGYDTGLPFN